MKILLATLNQGKVADFNHLLAAAGIKTEAITDLAYPTPAETGETFAENSLIKARAAYQYFGRPVLADDSGLCVKALNGKPGVLTARYGGYEKLLTELVKNENRQAYFECALTFIDQSGEVIQTTGTCRGDIALAHSGSDGFGYDPVFIPVGESRTFAEMTSAEKAKFSHRSAALKKLLASEFFKSHISRHS